MPKFLTAPFQNPSYPQDQDMTPEEMEAGARAASMARAQSPNPLTCLIEGVWSSTDQFHTHPFDECMAYRHDNVVGDNEPWTYWQLLDGPLIGPATPLPLPVGLRDWVLRATCATPSLAEVPSEEDEEMIDVHGLFWVDLNGINVARPLGGTNWMKIPFNREIRDRWGYFDTSTYQYRPLVPGLYFIHLAALVEYDQVADAAQAAIYRNGQVIAAGSYVNGQSTAAYSQVSTLAILNGTTDYIEAYAYLTATGLAIRGDAEGTYMFGYRMAPIL